MRKQPVLVAVAFLNCISRTLLYSLVASRLFLCSNISVVQAQTVDAGFIPCYDGHINAPAICTRAATLYYGWIFRD
jgi:hypothetical protein